MNIDRLVAIVASAVRVKDLALAISTARTVIPALWSIYQLFTRDEAVPATTEAEVQAALVSALAPWQRIEQVARQEIAAAKAGQ